MSDIGTNCDGTAHDSGAGSSTKYAQETPLGNRFRAQSKVLREFFTKNDGTYLGFSVIARGAGVSDQVVYSVLGTGKIPSTRGKLGLSDNAKYRLSEYLHTLGKPQAEIDRFQQEFDNLRAIAGWTGMVKKDHDNGAGNGSGVKPEDNKSSSRARGVPFKPRKPVLRYGRDINESPRMEPVSYASDSGYNSDLKQARAQLRAFFTDAGGEVIPAAGIIESTGIEQKALYALIGRGNVNPAECDALSDANRESLSSFLAGSGKKNEVVAEFQKQFDSMRALVAGEHDLERSRGTVSAARW